MIDPRDPAAATPPEQQPAVENDPRPGYEPPRIEKKRSVSRATLFSGGGAGGGGVIGRRLG